MEKRWNRARGLLLAGAFVMGLGDVNTVQAQTQSSGAAQPARLAFEVASIKPHAFARNEFSFATAARESPIRISGNRVTMQGLLAGLVLAAYVKCVRNCPRRTVLLSTSGALRSSLAR